MECTRDLTDNANDLGCLTIDRYFLSALHPDGRIQILKAKSRLFFRDVAELASQVHLVEYDGLSRTKSPIVASSGSRQQHASHRYGRCRWCSPTFFTSDDTFIHVTFPSNVLSSFSPLNTIIFFVQDVDDPRA